MISFEKAVAEKSWKDMDVLIIGKGPSYCKLKLFDTSSYLKVSLNHVVSDVRVDIAHMIDFDVFESCQYDVYRNAKFLLMPFYPHQSNSPGRESLIDLQGSYELLKKMSDEGRLFCYGLGTSKRNPKHILSVSAGYFSGDCIIEVLAKAGITSVTSIGIDGGQSYNKKFDYLKGETLLSNGRDSFDIQFDKIRAIIAEENIRFRRLDEDFPIKVYIATTEAQMLAAKVLEYSVRKNTAESVEILFMHQSGVSYREPIKVENRQRTPFSFQRFLIPQLNNYKGKAIYLDSDMQVFDDISKLWGVPVAGCDVLACRPSLGEGRRLHFSVMLLDCEKLDWQIEAIIDALDSGKISYSQLMHDMSLASFVSPSLDSGWNSLEVFKPGKTKLLHYTDMESQPWVSCSNPYESLWVKDLMMAVDEGCIGIDYIKDHVDKGWVRPGLLYQVENRIVNSNDLPMDVKRYDKRYRPPYEELVCAEGVVSNNLIKRLIVRGIKKARYYLPQVKN